MRLNAGHEVEVEVEGRKHRLELNFYMGPMLINSKGESDPNSFGRMTDALRKEAMRLYRERFGEKR